MFASPHRPRLAPSTKDLLVPCLSVAVVGLTLVCSWQRAELRRLTTAQDREPTNARLAVHPAREQTVVAALRPNARLGRGSLDRDDGSEFGATSGPFEFKRKAGAASPFAQLLANPDFLQALALHRQATIDIRFARLFRQLALSADELATFRRLLAEKENVALDVIAVSETQPDGPLPDSLLGASVDAARAQVDGDIESALGADRFAIYRDYENTLPQRAVVAKLEQRLSYSPTPLTPAQSESLVKILASHAPAPAPVATTPAAAVVVANGLLADAGTALDNSSALVSNGALDDARAVLAPHQVAALRQIQVEQQATAQAAKILRASLPPGDARSNFGWLLLQ